MLKGCKKSEGQMPQRERWASKVGLVLAAAGNAIGLGNLLRFPSKVAMYGGGAFMIPYAVSLFILGLPLMVLEWVVGRFAGQKGHGSMTGIFGAFFRQSAVARAVGSLGVAIPFLIACYYLYIESWTLGYSILSLLGAVPRPLEATEAERAMEPFLEFFKGYAAPSPWAIAFLVATLAVNWWVLQRGVRRGIEVVAKVGIPLLLGMGCFLAVVSLSLKGGRGLEGLAFIFRPDLSRLGDPQVWIEAAGQIFFTLSLGMGAIAVYASYVRRDEDVLKTGLWTAGLNEGVEVILGSAIAIPAAFALFGAASVGRLAAEGTFRIGFMSMPAVLMSLPGGQVLSFLWFFLLFLAALTSSLALGQPLIAFFEDEVGLEHPKAVGVTMGGLTVGSFLSALVPGFIDELDFWAGTLFLVLFAFIEVVAFVWIWGPRRFSEELNRDVFLRVPRSLVYVLYGLSAAFLAALFYSWAWLRLGPMFAESPWNLVVSRAFVGVVLVVLVVLAVVTARRFKGEGRS